MTSPSGSDLERHLRICSMCIGCQIIHFRRSDISSLDIVAPQS